MSQWVALWFKNLIHLPKLGCTLPQLIVYFLSSFLLDIDSLESLWVLHCWATHKLWNQVFCGWVFQLIDNWGLLVICILLLFVCFLLLLVLVWGKETLILLYIKMNLESSATKQGYRLLKQDYLTRVQTTKQGYRLLR